MTRANDRRQGVGRKKNVDGRSASYREVDHRASCSQKDPLMLIIAHRMSTRAL